MALEAESSNLSRHPTKDRSGPFLYGLSFYDGPSPSGKAEDFDSSIRRFKSGRPNQRIPRMGDAVFYFADVLQGLHRPDLNSPCPPIRPAGRNAPVGRF